MLRAFHVQGHFTFFTAVSIIDRYFIGAYHQKLVVGPEYLHLVGMAAVLIASKFEDVEPVTLNRLLKFAGRSMFSKLSIIAMEKSMLQTIGFRVLCPQSSYAEPLLAFKLAFPQANQGAEDYATFLCYLSVYSPLDLT